MHAYIKGSAWLSPSGFKTLTNRDQAASSPFITEESIQNIHLPKLPRVPDVAKACCAVVSQVLLEAGLTVPFAVRSEESERTALVVGNNDSSVRPIEALQRKRRSTARIGSVPPYFRIRFITHWQGTSQYMSI